MPYRHRLRSKGCKSTNKTAKQKFFHFFYEKNRHRRHCDACAPYCASHLPAMLTQDDGPELVPYTSQDVVDECGNVGDTDILIIIHIGGIQVDVRAVSGQDVVN